MARFKSAVLVVILGLSISGPSAVPISMTPDPVGDWVCLAGHCGASDSTRTVNITLLSGTSGPPAMVEFRLSVVGGGPFANSTVSFFFDLDVDITSANIAAFSGNFSADPVALGSGNGTLLEFNCLEAPCTVDMVLELVSSPAAGTIRDNVNQFVDSPGAPNQTLAITFAPVQLFKDVPFNHWAFSFIDALAASGITTGCGNDNYCPNDSVTRAQMAVFLERGINGSGYTPPAASGNVFLDVGVSDFAADFIEQLFADGITGGCGGNNYCPNDSVTRAQMAVFLLRAKYGSSYLPPPANGIFGDVDLSYWAVNWIEQLAAEGITSGCGGGNYCPNDPVTRAQMAVFLVRTFGL